MSTLHSQTDWKKIKQETLDSKYEKCRNITEEIYKRINLTFQFKKLENQPQSDLSESASIDSNDLSNETDLFACDKSSLSSSTDLDGLELGSIACEKYININNNEERVKQSWQPKRPKKRFRKRIKKQQKQSKQSDGSSDEALPLSRVGDIDVRRSTSPDTPNDVMGVPNIVIITSDLKYKIKSPTPVIDKKISKPEKIESKDNSELFVKDKMICKICNFTCRGERGLRRHMKMTHLNDYENADVAVVQRNSQ